MSDCNFTKPKPDLKPFWVLKVKKEEGKITEVVGNPFVVLGMDEKDAIFKAGKACAGEEVEILTRPF